MKILYKDKIVENFRFPITEALSFSILVWTIYGLLESFYLQRILPMVSPSVEHIHRGIYISAFFLYLMLAALMANLIYGTVKWILFTMNRHESPGFRGTTLALLLAGFFAMVLYHALTHEANQVFSLRTRTIFAGIVSCFGAFMSWILFTKASSVGFRLRRSGTTMASVLILSIVLSFVPFPLFARKDAAIHAAKQLNLKESIQKLTVYDYLSIVSPEKTEP